MVRGWCLLLTKKQWTQTFQTVCLSYMCKVGILAWRLAQCCIALKFAYELWKSIKIDCNHGKPELALANWPRISHCRSDSCLDDARFVLCLFLLYLGCPIQHFPTERNRILIKSIHWKTWHTFDPLCFPEPQLGHRNIFLSQCMYSSSSGENLEWEMQTDAQKYVSRVPPLGIWFVLWLWAWK